MIVFAFICLCDNYQYSGQAVRSYWSPVSYPFASRSLLSWAPFTVKFSNVFGHIDFTADPQILLRGARSTRNSTHFQTTAVSSGPR